MWRRCEGQGLLSDLAGRGCRVKAKGLSTGQSRSIQPSACGLIPLEWYSQRGGIPPCTNTTEIATAMGTAHPLLSTTRDQPLTQISKQYHPVCRRYEVSLPHVQNLINYVSNRPLGTKSKV